MFTNIKKLLKIAEINKFLLFIGLFFSLLSTIVALCFPMLLKIAIDSMISNKEISMLIIYSLIVLVVLDFLFTFISMYLLSKVGQQLILRLREKLWSRLLKTDFVFFQSNKVGNLVSHIIQDTSQLTTIFSTEFANFVTGLLTIVGTIIILIKIDFVLTLSIILVVPIIFMIITPTSLYLRNNSKKIQLSIADLSSYLTDRLGNIIIIKMSSAIVTELDIGRKKFIKIYKIFMKRNLVQAFFSPLIALVVTIIAVGIIILGISREIKGIISPGSLFAFVIYLVQIIGPILTVATFCNKLNIAVGASDKIIKLLSLSEEATFETNNSGISVNNLTLKDIYYSKNCQNIIRGISFSFVKGNMYNIVGFSGAGKTTLLNIICKLITPNSGQIDMNNKKSWNKYTWRNNISYVPQDVFVVDGTVKDNLLYGNSIDYSDEEINKLLIELDLFNTIRRLPNGINTIISKNSPYLSGGEKQRLSLLRGYLYKKDILLVDEISSNLDSKNSYTIYKFLEKHKKNKIIIIVTHKLSNFSDKDYIIVLDKGKVIASGNERFLIENCSLYSELKKYYSGNL